MITHLATSTAVPAVVSDDDQHYGPAVSSYGTVWKSRGEDLHVGVWQFKGEQRTRPRHGVESGYEEITTLVEGTLDIECDGVVERLEAGDSIIYDCPIGAKRLRAPDGFRAIYVVRYRSCNGGRVVKLDNDKTFESADQRLSAGRWQANGEQRSEAAEGYDELLVVTHGSLVIESDGSEHVARVGDVVVYESPLSAKIVRSSDLRATYIVRWHAGAAPRS